MNKGKENRERVDIINRINKFLAMLILLNVADGFLTYVGVQSGYAIEANAIMVPAVTNPVKLFLFKILLPSVLMGLLSFITQKTKDKSLVRIERFIVNKQEYSHLFKWEMNCEHSLLTKVFPEQYKLQGIMGV